MAGPGSAGKARYIRGVGRNLKEIPRWPRNRPTQHPSRRPRRLLRSHLIRIRLRPRRSAWSPVPTTILRSAKAEGYKVDPVPPVQTIADEQRRSVPLRLKSRVWDAWKAAHDERDPDEKPKVVPGVSHRSVG